MPWDTSGIGECVRHDHWSSTGASALHCCKSKHPSPVPLTHLRLQADIHAANKGLQKQQEASSTLLEAERSRLQRETDDAHKATRMRAADAKRLLEEAEKATLDIAAERKELQLQGAKANASYTAPLTSLCRGAAFWKGLRKQRQFL